MTVSKRYALCSRAILIITLTALITATITSATSKASLTKITTNTNSNNLLPAVSASTSSATAFTPFFHPPFTSTSSLLKSTSPSSIFSSLPSSSTSQTIQSSSAKRTSGSNYVRETGETIGERTELIELQEGKISVEGLTVSENNGRLDEDVSAPQESGEHEIIASQGSPSPPEIEATKARRISETLSEGKVAGAEKVKDAKSSGAQLETIESSPSASVHLVSRYSLAMKRRRRSNYDTDRGTEARERGSEQATGDRLPAVEPSSAPTTAPLARPPKTTTARSPTIKIRGLVGTASASAAAATGSDGGPRGAGSDRGKKFNARGTSYEAVNGLNEDGGDSSGYELNASSSTPFDAHRPHMGIVANHTNHSLFHKEDPLFPRDLFTDEQRRHGAIFLHVLGVVYMFVALAIVCDEFFVPSLDVIIEKLDIQDDVAGATFMAAGGSAPELFTSVIGVFVSFDDVGIGTIVGSAVFNILFVIGMCAIFSKTVLTLTWWPLFRDCFFYSSSLITLIAFFRDNYIEWYEALILFSFYVAYVSFMKWNQPMETWCKRLLYKNKVTRVRSTDQLMPTHQAAAQALHGTVATSSETSVGTQPGGSMTSRTASETPQVPSGGGGGGSGGGNTQAHHHQYHTGAKFRHGLLQLMIHTIDPLHDGKVDEKATQLHAIASLKVLLDATRPQNGAATSSAANHVSGSGSTATMTTTILNNKQQQLQQETTAMLSATNLPPDMPNGIANTLTDVNLETQRRMSSVRTRKSLTPQAVVCLQVGGGGDGDDGDQPQAPEALDISWPSGARKRITYVLLAPIVFPLWLTLPDTRSPRGKKFFPITFLGSILWIAAYSYLMVWWANMVGDTMMIPPEVMGLTFLAAGTSIPDLITSVIVARKGFGDMAVSSSVGSNIFDVTVGLPVPWLLYAIIYGKPVEVNSVGMVCSITILFMMLIFVIMSIACFRWKMNRGLGFTMFLLYFVFVAVSLMFEYEAIVCPV